MVEKGNLMKKDLSFLSIKRQEAGKEARDE